MPCTIRLSIQSGRAINVCTLCGPPLLTSAASNRSTKWLRSIVVDLRTTESRVLNSLRRQGHESDETNLTVGGAGTNTYTRGQGHRSRESHNEAKKKRLCGSIALFQLKNDIR